MVNQVEQIFFFLALIFLLVNITGVISHEALGHSFSYDPRDKGGPDLWGQMHVNWTKCAHGREQTPINILTNQVKVNTSLGPLQFSYKRVLADAFKSGHGIKVSIKGDGGVLKIDDKIYDLVQYHWHFPSEHTINGKSYALELHLVHSNHHHGLAVVGILFNYGRPNPLLETMLPMFRTISGKKQIEFMLDPKEIIFKSSRYYRYMGSLTTPPCTEGVVWTIMSKVNEVSWTQVREFEKMMNLTYSSIARPIQEMDGRVVYVNTAPQLSRRVKKNY